MKHRHTNLMIYPCIRYKWDIDARWILVQHVSDTRSYVSYLKNIIFRFGHASDIIRHGSDVRQTLLDTARIWPKHDLLFFFPIIWLTEKKIQRPKNLSSFKNLFLRYQ